MVMYANQGNAKYLGCVFLCLIYKTNLLVSPRSKQKTDCCQACSHWSYRKDHPKPHTLNWNRDVPLLFCKFRARVKAWRQQAIRSKLNKGIYVSFYLS